MNLYKLNVNLPEKDFNQIEKDGKILIFPRANPEWTRDNLIFRSSMWDKESGELISASFPKFMNWGERDDLFPAPKDIQSCTLMEKMDGSLLAVSTWKDEHIIRTRGMHDYSKQPNANEIPALMEKYPNILDQMEGYTDIFEWVTPSNKIILNYSEPDLIYIGRVCHYEYRLELQNTLDIIAKHKGFKRPSKYSFNTISEMITAIQALENKEGVCIYYNGDQNILKLKSLDYLRRHRFKYLCNDEQILDLFFKYGKPTCTNFVDKISTDFDYECAQMANPFISKIIIANEKAKETIGEVSIFVKSLNSLERREQAAQIFQNDFTDKNSGIAFTLLDGKEIQDKDMKKLIMKNIKGE